MENPAIETFKKQLADAVESLRSDFVQNDFWRGMDLDFISALQMSLGIDYDMATKLNEISLTYRWKKHPEG